jgi:hypothetical protein
MALRTHPTALEDAMPGRLADHRVALTGCHGVVVVENLRLADAARDHLGEFLLVISHARLRGARPEPVTTHA